MANIFEQTIVPKIPFSNFPLNESQLITHNFGQLIPCYVREVYPNDVFKLSAVVNTEFAPMVAPMKQDVIESLHFFFCPDRIVFDDWETFITGSEDGHALETEEELSRMPGEPGLKIVDFQKLYAGFNSPESTEVPDWQGTVFDYIGLPSNIGCSAATAEEEPAWIEEIISDLPLRMYFRIWYDYYRDENLQTSFYAGGSSQMTYYEFWRAWRKSENVIAAMDDSTNGIVKVLNALNFFQPYYRAFRKDYFTGALPSPQKGQPVTLNIGGDAPVTMKQSLTITNEDPEVGLQAILSSSYPPQGQSAFLTVGDAGNVNYAEAQISGTVQGFMNVNLLDEDHEPVVGFADLTRASGITVEALREAFAVQEILESLSIRGSRFCEFLRGNFGVVPDDYKLQRPQFLGGIVTPVAVQSVVQTAGYSDSDSRNMTGYAAGRAFAAAGRSIFRQRFKEHGYIIGIMSAMPKAYYYQGIPRHFLRHDRFDYYLPQTAHLGEQAIENQELFFDPANSDDKNKKVFGFIPRWAELKIATNGIHGDFRGNLNYYHMARVFESTPTLSEEFISTKNVQTRPFAVWQTENPTINHLLWTNLFIGVTASRPVPYHSVPKIQ